jgi:HEAT repeat protein
MIKAARLLIIITMAMPALTCGGPPPREYTVDDIPELLAMYKDSSTQEEAHEAFMKLGTDAVPAVIEAMRDEEPFMNCTIGALMAVGPDAIPHLIEVLDDEHPSVRQKAASTLGFMALFQDMPLEAIPPLVQLLDDDEKRVREAALNALGNFGPNAVEVIHEQSGFKSQEPEKSIQKAKGEIDLSSPLYKDAVPAIARALEDENWGTRNQAITALYQIGPGAKAALANLKFVAEYEEYPHLRAMALKVIDVIEGRPAQDRQIYNMYVNTDTWRIPELIEDLDNEKWMVRRYSAHRLGTYEENAKDAAPALIKAIKDENSRVRSYAAESLGRIGPMPGVVNALIEALGDEDLYVRKNAAYSLGSLGPDGTEAIPTLIEMLKDEDSSIREAATYAIGKIEGTDNGDS